MNLLVTHILPDLSEEHLDRLPGPRSPGFRGQLGQDAETDAFDALFHLDEVYDPDFLHRFVPRPRPEGQLDLVGLHVDEACVLHVLLQLWSGRHVVPLSVASGARHLVESVQRALGRQRAILAVDPGVPVLKFDVAAGFGVGVALSHEFGPICDGAREKASVNEVECFMV